MSRMVFLLSPFSFLLSPLIPLRGLFLLRTSAIQASLIALGLASVLLSPFSFLSVRSTATVSLCPPIYNS